MKLPRNSVAFDYISEYEAVFLDSGAFGSAFYDGGFTYSCEQYAELADRVRPTLWAAMDYPCEPKVRNGLTVEQRIGLTIENTLVLASKGIPGFVPVIQGWEPKDYIYCADALEGAGLIGEVMGIGSICRRGKREPIIRIIREMHTHIPNVKFHAFGVKVNVLKYNNGEMLNYLDSIDTAAWQFNEKDELGGWQPRTYAELERRLKGYKEKLDLRVGGPYQLVF